MESDPFEDDDNPENSERKKLEKEFYEYVNIAQYDDMNESVLTSTASEADKQPDILQQLQSVCLMKWKESDGEKYEGTGFLAKIKVGSEVRIGFHTAGHNMLQKNKQLVDFNTVKLKFKHIGHYTNSLTLKELLSKLKSHVIVCANKETKIFLNENGDKVEQTCREGIDFCCILFTSPVDRIAKIITKMGLNYLEIAEQGTCGPDPDAVVTLIGFPKFVETKKMRFLLGKELQVMPGNLPDNKYTIETAPGASGGPVNKQNGEVKAIHIRGNREKNGDLGTGNKGLSFDTIRNELAQYFNCINLEVTSIPCTIQGKTPLFKFLEKLNLDNYSSTFEKESIDFEGLLKCDKEELTELFEALDVKLGHRLTIKRALEKERSRKMVSFSCLYRELDLPLRIFSFVSPEDLCSIELVCHDWRNIIINQNQWRRRLKLKQSNYLSWQTLLDQIKWDGSQNSDHLTSKRLFITVSITLGPHSVTPALLERIQYDSLEKPLSQASTLSETAWLKRTQSDFDTITSSAPAGGFHLPDNIEVSRLAVFGPAAFPVLVTEGGCVVMAGARYGKGRIIVVGHEEMLKDPALMRGAADWCGGRKNCGIVCDPTTKAWNGRWEYKQAFNWCPPGSAFLPRDQLTGSASFAAKMSAILWSAPVYRVPVYLTQGHYEDHADSLIEFVKEGGGLIVGGHAWWWNVVNNGNRWPRELRGEAGVCSLVEHPGNQIIVRMGIAFSRSTRTHDDKDKIIRTRRVPSLKTSFRQALIYLRSGSIGDQVLKESLYSLHNEVLQEFIDERLQNVKHFEEIRKLTEIENGK